MTRRFVRRIPAAFAPLMAPSRYKGVYGGRGSGKSHDRAEAMIERHLEQPGTRSVCIREVQKTLSQSAKKLIEDKLQKFELTERDGFKVYSDVIKTPGDGLILFQGMQDHTADSIKSLEGIDTAWVEEAQSLSERSITLLRPTIRKEASELWFTWNPQRPTDPIERLLRSDATPTGAIVIRANWNANPWFPSVLEQERQDGLRLQPERYGHIWEGEYATVLEGAYYAKAMTEAQLSGRIGFAARDPLLPVYLFWDIGGTSGRADACAIWACQFIGAEVRVLDYYEAVGQSFDAHVSWMRQRDYAEGTCVLPHDGATHDKVFAVTPQGFLGKAGFRTEVVPNQGAGAALARIEAARQVFPSVRFNEETTKHGREALGYYHEKRDEIRLMGLGPNHDWSSHGADAFGLMAVWRLRNPSQSTWGKPLKRTIKGI